MANWDLTSVNNTVKWRDRTEVLLLETQYKAKRVRRGSGEQFTESNGSRHLTGKIGFDQSFQAVED